MNSEQWNRLVDTLSNFYQHGPVGMFQTLEHLCAHLNYIGEVSATCEFDIARNSDTFTLTVLGETCEVEIRSIFHGRKEAMKPIWDMIEKVKPKFEAMERARLDAEQARVNQAKCFDVGHDMFKYETVSLPTTMTLTEKFKCLRCGLIQNHELKG
jgi:urease accessory protein UreF